MKIFKILICDDHLVCCLGLKVAIENIEHDRPLEFFFAHTGAQAEDLIKQHQFDYIFMDMKLPDYSGMAAIHDTRAGIGRSKVIIFTSYTDIATSEEIKRGLLSLPIHAVLQKTNSTHSLSEAFEHFRSNVAQPYLCRDSAALLNGIANSQITKRELEVVQLIAKGMITREISQQLGCSKETVKSHRANLLAKTGCRNVAELSAWYSDRYGKSGNGTTTEFRRYPELPLMHLDKVPGDK